MSRNSSNAPSSYFDGVWWQVNLPPEWRGHADPECATFQRSASGGALQISSARKDAEPVTDKDLRDFAEERVPHDKNLVPVSCGPFSGFSAEYVKEGSFWKEWWLRLDRLMVYATYNTAEGAEEVEREDVGTIIGSLLPKSSNAPTPSVS